MSYQKKVESLGELVNTIKFSKYGEIKIQAGWDEATIKMTGDRLEINGNRGLVDKTEMFLKEFKRGHHKIADAINNNKLEMVVMV